MGYYYSESLAGKRLERCYQIAPPRVVQYFESEIRFVNTHIERGFSVLELGSGYGRALSQFGNNTQRIVGIDISMESLELAKQRMHHDIEMIQTNAINLPFQDKSFDV
ncbi:MAG: class I SAM-dependent methyltransferase, partial [Candidatus Thorarchaeota archaeon]